MAKNNYPQAAIDELEPSVVHQIVTSLRELHDKGRPQTDEEVRQRIDEYFTFCEASSCRPGVESLCLALHITRNTLFNWSHGVNCSERRMELAQSAKAFISAFLEQATLQGKLNPASSCFLFKNWCGYRDTISFETEEQPTETRVRTSAELLADMRKLTQGNTLPRLTEDGE